MFNPFLEGIFSGINYFSQLVAQVIVLYIYFSPFATIIVLLLSRFLKRRQESRPEKEVTVPKKTRVAIYIDGSNFLCSLKELSGFKNPSKNSMPSAIEVFNREVQFNYAAFIDMICSQKECVIKNYYIGSVSERSYPNANKSYLRNLRNNEQILDQHLSAHGLTVVKQPMVYDAGGFKQKGVDAHLTCDMLDDARDNKYDEAVLISSDRDFIPLIQRVREHGKKTIVIGFDVKQPFRLMEVADYNIILNDHLLSSYVSLPESQVKTIFKSANNPASSKEVQGVSAPCAAAGI